MCRTPIIVPHCFRILFSWWEENCFFSMKLSEGELLNFYISPFHPPTNSFTVPQTSQPTQLPENPSCPLIAHPTLYWTVTGKHFPTLILCHDFQGCSAFDCNCPVRFDFVRCSAPKRNPICCISKSCRQIHYEGTWASCGTWWSSWRWCWPRSRQTGDKAVLCRGLHDSLAWTAVHYLKARWRRSLVQHGCRSVVKITCTKKGREYASRLVVDQGLCA